MSFSKTRSLVLVFCVLSVSCTSLLGCSLFFGNIRPIEEKSKDYSIQDLAADDPNWLLLDRNADGGNSNYEAGRSDIAYQSKSTAAIISVSSACRKFPNSDKVSSLQELTQELLLGLSDVTSRKEEELKISGAPALQTTVQGKMIQKGVKLRAVVVRIDHCLFDLMYVSEPAQFEKELKTFSKFILSIRVGS